MPRLQFSLRALLLLMALVGAAIVVYRWPWTETKMTKGETITTQYHRGWTGKALKHGVQRTTTNSPIVNADWYEDGELRRKRVFQGEIVYNDQSFRNGQLDGPYHDFGATSTTRGNYRLGKKHGAWQYAGFQVIEDEIWRNGERHGPRTWKTPQGRVLQTAEYAEGRLTYWNGQPAAEEFRRWMKATIPDVGLQQKLLATIRRPYAGNPSLHHSEKLYFVGDPAEPLVVQWDQRHVNTLVQSAGPAIGDEILAEALDNSHMLAYRFHILHVVPITPQELDWRDKTGVSDVQFSAGSPAEQYWLTPAAGDLWVPNHAIARIRHLFEHDGPIELDTSAVEHLSPILTSPTDPNLTPHQPRIRRDLLSQHLNHAGFFCELKNGKLIILPLLVEGKPNLTGPGGK